MSCLPGVENVPPAATVLPPGDISPVPPDMNSSWAEVLGLGGYCHDGDRDLEQRRKALSEMMGWTWTSAKRGVLD